MTLNFFVTVLMGSCMQFFTYIDNIFVHGQVMHLLQCTRSFSCTFWRCPLGGVPLYQQHIEELQGMKWRYVMVITS